MGWRYLPTWEPARFASPLNVWDFVHIVSLIALDPDTAVQIGPIAAQIATAESLTAHARAALMRLNTKDLPANAPQK